MRIRNRLWIGGAVFAIIGVYFAAYLVAKIRAVNEPDAETFSQTDFQAQLKLAGVRAIVDRQMYINRDVNSYVFEGKLTSLDPAMFSGSGDEILDRVYNAHSGRFGGVLVRPGGDGRQLIGVLAATTRGEFRQFRGGFIEKFQGILRTSQAK